MTPLSPLDSRHLPAGVRARMLSDINGMDMHVLEAGHESPGRPCVILLHGFPELAFSWRKVMVPLAEAGYHVVAPDQRGFGRTTGWDTTYDADLAPFRVLNLVRDVVALVAALGYRSVAGVFGHDAGARVAAYCALIRPDLFQSVAIMSSPFPGPPTLPFGTAVDGARPATAKAEPEIHESLAALARPRKHYQNYYTTRPANDDMWKCPQGVGAFMRAYYHYKSADWNGNRPYRLAAWRAEELAKMPTYYIMDRDCDMAETVAPFMPSEFEIAACRWLTEPELAVYKAEYGRTGFQGGLQWYRCNNGPEQAAEMRLFSGRVIRVPAKFIAGANDWGTYQRPGAFEAMQTSACERMLGSDLIPGSGHWVQQEKPEAVVESFLKLLEADR